MAVTQRTVEEAENYIEQAIERWKFLDEEKKIISLASLAEKWSSDEIGPLAKIKTLQKSIRGLELIINRNDRAGFHSGALDDHLVNFKLEYEDLVSKHGEPKGSVKKSKAEIRK